MEQKQKIIAQLDTLYTEVQWPKISPENQETILGVFASFLAPVGRYRAGYITPSKGKRSKKRKTQGTKRADSSVRLNESEVPPPVPEISSHLLIGLATITRHLELIASTHKAAGIHECGTTFAYDSSIRPRHLLAIFVCRPSQPSPLHAHLPQLIATTSIRSPSAHQTRLIQLPLGSESCICSSLGLPRASFVGVLERAPNSGHLLQLVRDMVPLIEILWLAEEKKA